MAAPMSMLKFSMPSVRGPNFFCFNFSTFTQRYVLVTSSQIGGLSHHPRCRSTSSTQGPQNNDEGQLGRDKKDSQPPGFVNLQGRSARSEMSFPTPSSLSPESSAGVSGKDRLGHVMQMYEDVVGLTEVKQAQEKVVNAEQKFLQVQEDRRALQNELLTVQAEVRRVGAELEKTSRTDSRYIELVKQEHEALLIEKEMTNKVKVLDKAERDFFGLLSAALRESHEKERARAEKTKYWSIIGSVIGAIIGIVGSTFNNLRRMKELRAIVTESGENTAEYKALANKMLDTVVTQHTKLEEFVQSIANSEDEEILDRVKIVEPLFVNHKDFREHTETVLQSLEKHSSTIFSQMKQLQDTVAIQRSRESDNHVVYVGPELRQMLLKTEQTLKNDIKKQSWMATAALGGVVTIGLSLIVFVFRPAS